SLEEILASIRKALAEEEVQGAADSPAAAKPAQATVEQPAPAKSDGLSGKLAGALNGSGRETVADDNLDDLLAPLPEKGASPPPAEPEPPAAALEEKKDPLWFLARKPAPESEPPKDDAAREPEREENAAPPPADVTLTRPETLRSSLPPLFGTDES